MSYAQAKHVTVDAIPVIDISDLYQETPDAIRAVADQLRKAAETAGFFYVKNHSIPQSLIDQVFQSSKFFYDSPQAVKDTVKVNSFHRGYLQMGVAKMSGEKKPDMKESFIWGRHATADDPDLLAGKPLTGVNQWPDAVPGMEPTLMAYMHECNTLGRLLLKAFATSLEIEPDYFVKSIDRPITRCSIIHYPPQPETAGSDQFGVGAHTDYGCLTLLYQDQVGGLQVCDKNGDWVTAHPIEGTFVVNVGDLLARWSNDRFASTPHRVVNSSGKERYSIAVFVDPNYDADVTPVTKDGETPHYETVSCGDYIRGRLSATMSYDKESKESKESGQA